MPAAQKALIPFRLAARERFRQVDVRTYSSGNQATPIKLPEVGFLNAIVLVVEGTFNLGASATLVDKGPWNLIKRITVDTNLGTSNIVDLSGFGAYLNAVNQKRAFGPDGAGLGTVSSLIYSAPIATGNNTWKLVYYIPIAANDANEFDVGTINLQAPEIQANVNITFGTQSDVVATNPGTGFTGTVTCYYRYWDVPNPNQVAWPANQIVRTIEENTPILYTGDFTYYQILRQGYLLDLISYITVNGSLSNAFDQSTLRVNKNDTIYVFTPTTQKLRGYMANSAIMPTGVFPWGLWEAMGSPSQDDTRDGMNTEKVTTLEVGYQISTSATLGSGNNFLSNIRRVLVNLVPPQTMKG